MILHKKMPSPRVLGLFQIIMINVIAVDSIRTLPFAAEYGFSLVFYYLLGALCFFIPSALVSAELASGWPNTGGIYVWVREAFGLNLGLITIWLEWICNVVWFPTIMALIAGVATYLFDPSLASNKFYMIGFILVLFWGATLLNCFGMKASSWLSTFTAIIGTIIPMTMIALMGIYWKLHGHPTEISFTLKEFLPSKGQIENLAFLSNVLFGLIGLDMAATHAAEMKNPRKDYPKALFFSVIIILSTIIFSSLGIALVVPVKDLNLVTGCLQAFQVFLQKFNMPWMIPLVAFFIVAGGLGGVGAWIIGPTKGLMVASEDGSLPKFLSKKNRFGVPTNVLLLQAVIVSLLSLAFVIMPSVNSSFWLLSAITAQIAMIVYVFLFLAAIKLRFSNPQQCRLFEIPFGKAGSVVVGGIGTLTCLAAIVFGFIPPVHIGLGNVLNYELMLIGGVVGMCLLPYVIHKFTK